MAFKLTAITILLIFSSVLAGQQEEDAINAVLDDFHSAAASADEERYLDHLTEDAVFMGTDEWERWPKNPDFRAYVNRRFQNGVGWNYKSIERKIRISQTGNVAWFDEVVFSATNGRFRGTGVLVKIDDMWKINHYALSFLILNENWQEIVKLTKKTRQASTQN